MPTEKHFQPQSRAQWRRWLQQHHATETVVWLVYKKATSGLPTVSYSDAVDEALCFGWIDSKAQSVDTQSYRQLFSRRKPNSVWSKVNKEKVGRLIGEGLMTEAGLQAIERAKANGSWNILDDAENGTVPPDLQKAFRGKGAAKKYFEGLSRTDRRNLLQWLVLAKKAETRQKRIAAIVACAAELKKPKGF